MAIKCNICEKELDAFSGGRCKICRALVCPNCMASGGTDKKNGIICKNCLKEQQSSKKQAATTQNTEEQESTQQTPPNKIRIGLLILGCFAVLSLFIYIITIPYITTRNALNIVEFGPDEKFQQAKEDLADLSGTFVLERLEDMLKNGKKNTAIRAAYALGSQPNPKAVLILRQLQASEDCPVFLKSVIIEAIMEHERLYDPINSEVDKKN